MIPALVLLLAALAFVASPFLVPGFNGFVPTQFPVPQYDPPVQPAGYAFMIWGVIYVWLLISVVFGLVRRASAPDWAAYRPALSVSLAIGATWLAVAEQSPVIATVLIWAMLGAALVALAKAPQWDRWYARAPVALYAGWLTAASAVALGLVLGGYDIAGEEVAAWAMLGLALVIGIVVLLAIPDCAEYGASLAWASVGIAVANEGPLMVGALAAAVLVAALAVRSARLEMR